MTTTPTRRDLCLGILAGGAAAALSSAARAGGDEGPCPDLIGRKVRVLGPDSAMTMDYNPERVNIFHDENFVITEISFG